MSDRQARTDEPADRPDNQPDNRAGGTPNADNGTEIGMETPDADAAEQRAAVTEEPSPPAGPHAMSAPRDIDEADAADQERVVELDEDDYR